MPTRSLNLHEDYSRREVHDIFDPDTQFIPQTGKWGVWGLIELADRPGDFVFMVTYGKREGNHVFDEGITTEGLLRWQSKPAQTLADRDIQRLTSHDIYRNSIHLFLRTAARGANGPPPYTYLGRLAYDGHDRERERPVHFRWRLLDWPIGDDVRRRMGLKLEDEFTASLAEKIENTGPVAAEPDFAARDKLIEEEPPLAGRARSGESTANFRSPRRRPSEEESRKLGLAGELLVLKREMSRLCAAGRPDLAQRILHVSVVEGDHAGHDIRSFFHDGRPKYVEVKTTTGPKETAFFVTANEAAFSARHAAAYELCRVFSYDRTMNSARSYSVFGDLALEFVLVPTEYRARRGGR